MSKKTLHKKRIKKTVRRYKSKKNKKINKNIFTKKEKVRIDKILNELENDMNYILGGSKAQVKNKKEKLKRDINFLSGNKMGDQSGGGWKKNAGYTVGFALTVYLGCDAAMDPASFSQVFGWLNLGISSATAAKALVIIIRMASKPLFRSFSNKAMAHLGCDRYVKQSMSQEECNEKNILLYEMGETIKSLQTPLTMMTSLYMALT